MTIDFGIVFELQMNNRFEIFKKAQLRMIERILAI